MIAWKLIIRSLWVEIFSFFKLDLLLLPLSNNFSTYSKDLEIPIYRVRVYRGIFGRKITSWTKKIGENQLNNLDMFWNSIGAPQLELHVTLSLDLGAAAQTLWGCGSNFLWLWPQFSRKCMGKTDFCIRLQFKHHINPFLIF